MSDGQVAHRPACGPAPARRVAPQIRHGRHPAPACRPGRRGPPAGRPPGSPAVPASCGRNRRRPAGPAARGARLRVRQPQPLPRAGDAHVEQPALLLDRLVGPRVRGRQRALDEPDQEDRVPLQALGRVQAGQGHAVHRGARAGRRRAGSAPRGTPPASPLPRRVRRLRPRAALGPGHSSPVRPARPAPPTAPGQPRRPGARPGASPRRPSASTTRRQRRPLGLARPAARSATIAWRTSARSKNRSAPCTTVGTPASASASSYASDWALVRNSTAISRAGVPPAISSAHRAATAAASVGSSGKTRRSGSGPGGRCPTSSSRSRAWSPRACRITSLASADHLRGGPVVPHQPHHHRVAGSGAGSRAGTPRWPR